MSGISPLQPSELRSVISAVRILHGDYSTPVAVRIARAVKCAIACELFSHDMFLPDGSRRDCSESDTRILQALRPHISAAVAISARMARLKQQHDTLQRAVDATGQGVLVLTASGSVRFLSESAGQLLERCFGKPLESEALPDAIADWLRRLRHGPGEAALPDPQPSLHIKGVRCNVTIRLVGDSEPGLLLLVREAQVPATELICSAAEAESINLTVRELEVLRWVEQGMGNADIAVLCHVSARTVQKHLEHIFCKLNVENRIAAVRKLREHLSARRSW